MSSVPATQLQTRRPFRPGRESAEQVAIHAGYVESRGAYKRELLDELESRLGRGPALELSGGYGSLGLELAARRPELQLHVLCESEAALALCAERAWERGVGSRSHLILRRGGAIPLPESSLSLVLSSNCLHEWEDPVGQLREAFSLVRGGGWLVVDDLRRDADPFITEYVLREMAGEETEAGRAQLDIFVASLASAHTAAELGDLIRKAGLGGAEVQDGEPMTITAWMRKEG